MPGTCSAVGIFYWTSINEKRDLFLFNCFNQKSPEPLRFIFFVIGYAFEGKMPRIYYLTCSALEESLFLHKGRVSRPKAATQ